MLTDEQKQSLRQLAEGVSSTLKDADREAYGQAAHIFKDVLREVGCDDDTGAHVARLIARLLGTIEATPLLHAADVTDANLAAYAFAAASFAGVYELPPRKDLDELGPEREPEPVRVVKSESVELGGYL